MSWYYEAANYLTDKWWYWVGLGGLVVLFFYVTFRRPR